VLAPHYKVLNHLFQLSGRIVHGVRVVDDRIGGRSLARQGPLAGLTLGKLFGRPASPRLHASDSIGLRRVDEDHDITQVIPSRLQQHRGVEHNRLDVRLLLQFPNRVLQERTNFRMHDGFQIPPSGFGRHVRAENDSPERRA